MDWYCTTTGYPNVFIPKFGVWKKISTFNCSAANDDASSWVISTFFLSFKWLLVNLMTPYLIIKGVGFFSTTPPCASKVKLSHEVSDISVFVRRRRIQMKWLTPSFINFELSFIQAQHRTSLNIFQNVHFCDLQLSLRYVCLVTFCSKPNLKFLWIGNSLQRHVFLAFSLIFLT